MFEAEYARRRTTAEAEAGRICSGDTVYLAGGPLLPVDFAAALHRRAAELHGGIKYKSPASPDKSGVCGAFSVSVALLWH